MTSRPILSLIPHLATRLIFGLVTLFLYTVGSVLAAPMTFRETGNGGNCDGCAWFAGEGEITSDTPMAFSRFMADKRYHFTIYLDSPGGNLAAGLKLGVLIRNARLSTGVAQSVPEPLNPLFDQLLAGKCVSACAYAFLGGVRRSAQAGEIGVHQFYHEDAFTDPSGKLFSALDLSRDQFIAALVIDHVSRMGTDPRVVSVASTTPPNEMHYFDEDELDDLKVRWDPDVFQAWAIEPYGQGVVVYSKTQDRAKTATFFCRRNKAPRLLIADPTFGEAHDIQGAIDVLLDSFQALGLKLPKEAASVRMVDGAPALEIQLLGFDSGEIQNAKELTVSTDGPHVSMGYFYHLFSIKNALASFRVALRNCI